MGLSGLEQVRRPAAGWSLSLYPQAGEGGGCFVSSRPRVMPLRVGPAADPERARAEAGRRARARLRRYCAANRLNRLGTLTYAGDGCFDPVQARRDVGVFMRELRCLLGEQPLPYAWVPEWHKSHGLHLHFAVARYTKKSLIDQAWGHGFVHIKLLADVPVGAGSLGEARRAAGYLSKYVSKAFTDDRLPRRHRYDVAQGFQPAKVVLRGRSAGDVLGQASRRIGCAPDRVWHSADTQGWQGPPAVWASWGG